MLDVIKFMLDNFFPADTEHEHLRHRCVATLHDMYKTLEAPWTDFSGKAVAQLARMHCICYDELRNTADSDILWRQYPKHHLFIHCLEEQVFIYIYIYIYIYM
jgi:hypothetical protein